MQLFIGDYTFPLLAVLAFGWLLSWWAPPRVRWCLLAVAAAVSVFCIGRGIVGLSAAQPLDPPKPYECSPAVECTDFSPFPWLPGGALGLGCSIVAALATFAIESVRERMGFGEVATLGRRDHASRRLAARNQHEQSRSIADME